MEIPPLYVADPESTFIGVFPAGVNNVGQVTGRMRHDGLFVSGQRNRAFVWLPNAMASIPAGTHLLSELFQAPSVNTETEAEALNDTGLIVGTSFSAGANAYYWDLASPTTSGALPLTACIGDVGQSGATDVSNEPYPAIVGWMSTCTVEFNCSPGVTQWTFGFRYDMDTGQTDSFLPVGSEGCNEQHLSAYWVEVNAYNGIRLVGASGRIFSSQICIYSQEEGKAPAAWVAQLPSIIHTPALNEQGCPSAPAAGEAFDINLAGNIVGFKYDPVYPNDGIRRATFWEDATASAFALPTLDAADEEMEAYAIAQPFDDDRLQVVGHSYDEFTAVLWDRNDVGQWSVIKLLDEADPHFCNEGDNKWTNLIAATDINDYGWIVGYGTRENLDGIRGFVLIPQECPYPDCGFTCLGDINLDGVVDVSDLLALLAAWGPSVECSLADLNGDGVVDVSDLLILLANWGPCPWSSQVVPTLEDVMAHAGLSMDGWDAFVDVMTNSSDAFEKENWNCWMQQYINGCQLCPACPSTDPLEPYRLD